MILGSTELIQGTAVSIAILVAFVTLCLDHNQRQDNQQSRDKSFHPVLKRI